MQPTIYFFITEATLTVLSPLTVFQNVLLDKGCCLQEQTNQLIRVWYISHFRAAKAQASLRICTGSSEPSHLAFAKQEHRRRLMSISRLIVPLDCCACMFEE